MRKKIIIFALVAILPLQAQAFSFGDFLTVFERFVQSVSAIFSMEQDEDGAEVNTHTITPPNFDDVFEGENGDEQRNTERPQRTVTDNNHVGAFTATPSKGVAPLTVHFSDVGQSTMDYGDGGTCGGAADAPAHLACGLYEKRYELFTHTYRKPGVYHVKATAFIPKPNTVLGEATVVVKSNLEVSQIHLSIEKPLRRYKGVRLISNGDKITLSWKDKGCGDDELNFYLVDQKTGKRVAKIGSSHCKGQGGYPTGKATFTFGVNKEMLGYVDTGSGASGSKEKGFYGDTLKTGYYFIEAETTASNYAKSRGVKVRRGESKVFFVSRQELANCSIVDERVLQEKKKECAQLAPIYDTVFGKRCIVDYACKDNPQASGGVSVVRSVTVPEYVAQGGDTIYTFSVAPEYANRSVITNEEVLDENGNKVGSICHVGRDVLAPFSGTERRVKFRFPRGKTITECPGFVSHPGKKYRLKITGELCPNLVDPTRIYWGCWGAKRETPKIAPVYSNWFMVVKEGDARASMQEGRTNWQWIDAHYKNTKFNWIPYRKFDILAGGVYGYTDRSSNQYQQKHACILRYGGRAPTCFWVVGRNLDDIIDTKEALFSRVLGGAIDSDKEALFWFLYHYRGLTDELYLANVNGVYVVKVTHTNTFGCGDHRPAKAIYTITRAGHIQQIAKEILPPKKARASIMCVD